MPILASELLVSHNAVRGSFVGKVTAQDDDGDPITFRITNVEDSVQRTFEIAKETGTL